jgi:hypothetical protein
LEALLDRFVENFDRLQESVGLAGMELTLVPPFLGDENDGVEVLRALRAMRSHLQDGNEANLRLLDDLDWLLGLVDGA